MKNKVVIVSKGYLYELERYLEEGWVVKMVIPEFVSSGSSNYSGKKGDMHYVLEKEGDR